VCVRVCVCVCVDTPNTISVSGGSYRPPRKLFFIDYLLRTAPFCMYRSTMTVRTLDRWCVSMCLNDDWRTRAVDRNTAWQLVLHQNRMSLSIRVCLRVCAASMLAAHSRQDIEQAVKSACAPAADSADRQHALHAVVAVRAERQRRQLRMFSRVHVTGIGASSGRTRCGGAEARDGLRTGKRLRRRGGAGGACCDSTCHPRRRLVA
jgi:hypothetical protein